MPNYAEKQKVIDSIKEKLQASKGVVLVDYRGLTVAQDTDLRNKLRVAGVEYRVLKNTMIQRAANEIELAGLDSYLEGPTAVAFSPDPVAAAKILVEYSKKVKALEIKAGIVEGKVVDANGVRVVAELPPREVLLAQVLAGIQGPLQGMVNVLQGPLRKVAYVLEDLRKSKEAA